MKTKLYVVYGGKSAEHEVSLITAHTVIHALDRHQYDVYPIYINPQGEWFCSGLMVESAEEPDKLRIEGAERGTAASMGDILSRYLAMEGPKVVFPVIHGTHGEDGTLQGMLEMLDLPYVGNGVLASAVGMDKVMMKECLAGTDVLQAPYRSLLIHEWEGKEADVSRELEETIGLPCYVKPANMGSSVGISRCGTQKELEAALATAFQYDRKLVIEQEIVGREVQLAVIGNDHPVCSVGGEFVREPDFFDFEKKYRNGKLVKRIPAELTEQTEQELRSLALSIYKRLNGSGLMRLDFFVTEHNDCYLNEVNTLPGFTANSMFPVLWEATDGTAYSELLDRLIGLALDKQEQKQKLSFARR